ncbi:hypothetical protein [Bacillus sp. 03113]|uniref:hypothetical protein n=1 Tax=Bacillus sp. 03113 TaxID=2578211 RepID=UPI0015E8BBBC|nr:hypothetical protein [Bacillus sp. 03113]
MDYAGQFFSFFALIPLITSLGLFIVGVWFAVSLIKILREKNEILKEIAQKVIKKEDE